MMWAAFLAGFFGGSDNMVDKAVACGAHTLQARTLLGIERVFGFPEEVQGLILATACHEARFRSDARGDYRPFVLRSNPKEVCPSDKLGTKECRPCRRSEFGRKCKPRAHGMFQWWPWVKKHGLRYRDDWVASGVFWAMRVVLNVERVMKHCLYSRVTRFGGLIGRIWSAAEVTAVRAPVCAKRNKRGHCTKSVPRCLQVSRHWERFVEWSSPTIAQN